MSPDILIEDQQNSQSFNLYSYVRNNPLKYTDPTRHCSYEGDLGSSDYPCDPAKTLEERKAEDYIQELLKGIFNRSFNVFWSRETGMTTVNEEESKNILEQYVSQNPKSETKLVANEEGERWEDQAANGGATDISQAGLEFIAGYEGYSSTIYKDVAGLETIGYGHLIKPGEDFSNGVTEVQGLVLLKQDAQFAVNGVNRYTTVSLNQNQFDALTSFTFNVGAGALRNSTLLRMVNAGNLGAIPNSFMMWNKARVNGVLTPVQGLTNRRTAESNLYINGTY